MVVQSDKETRINMNKLGVKFETPTKKNDGRRYNAIEIGRNKDRLKVSSWTNFTPYKLFHI